LKRAEKLVKVTRGTDEAGSEGEGGSVVKKDRIAESRVWSRAESGVRLELSKASADTKRFFGTHASVMLVLCNALLCTVFWLCTAHVPAFVWIAAVAL
jgi:hypothetical protein